MNHRPTYIFLPSRSWSSFTEPGRMEGWVGPGGWLHTEKMSGSWLNSDTITHLSTNRARRRLTSLIETNALLLRQTSQIVTTHVATRSLVDVLRPPDDSRKALCFVRVFSFLTRRRPRDAASNVPWGYQRFRPRLNWHCTCPSHEFYMESKGTFSLAFRHQSHVTSSGFETEQDIGNLKRPDVGSG